MSTMTSLGIISVEGCYKLAINFTKQRSVVVAEVADFATDVRLGSPLLWYVDEPSQEHVPISILILVFFYDRHQRPDEIFH